MYNNDAKERSRMKIDMKYIRQIAKSETIFDMAAICYGILEKEIANPILFISQYLDEDGAAEFNNPNSKKLREFSDSVGIKLEEYSEFEFDQNSKYIVELLQKLELQNFMEKKKNQLSVLFTLLSTIDSLVPFWRKQNIVESGPLNRGNSQKTHLVYLASNRNLHEEMIQKIGRERKSSGGIGETLKYLIFLKIVSFRVKEGNVSFRPYRAVCPSAGVADSIFILLRIY